MLSQRQRAVGWAVAALAAIWVLAASGYLIARHLKVTPEKVRAFIESTDLSKLSAEDRARAIKRLEDQLNALSLEDRRSLRLGREMDQWFKQMTEAEKEAFIEATMPTGIKQMLTAFEALPADKRQRTVDDAIKRMREDRQRASTNSPAGGTNAAPISPELEAKMRETGLKSFYSQSSAQTKAEMAPLLEEMQTSMQSGRAFRGGPR